MASVNLHTPVNLENAATELPSSIRVNYIPDQFPGLIIKLDLDDSSDENPPKRSKKKEKGKTVTILLFSSGKSVVTGAKTKQSIYTAVDILQNLLNGIGVLIADDPAITIQNVVVSGNFGEPLNLELVALTLETSMYEPEVFPGLIYRMQDPKVVFLLFQSGKFVCTGCKREEIAYDSARKLRIILEDVGALGWELGL